MSSVVNIQENKKRFEVLWYKRKGKSSVFHASKNKDGTDYTTILETETVMFWDLQIVNVTNVLQSPKIG